MVTTNFVWDELSDNVLMEVDEAGDVTAEYTNEPDQFGELISQRRNQKDSYYHFDAQHSTRQLTTESQEVSDSYTYSAFGEMVSSSGATTHPFQYIGGLGYYTDLPTNDIFVRRRNYQPEIARWLSTDQLSFADGANRYEYVSNCPMRFLDPSGKLKIRAEPPFGIGFDGVCGSAYVQNYYLTLSNPRVSNKKGGYFIQKVVQVCEYVECGSTTEKGFDGPKIMFEAFAGAFYVKPGQAEPERQQALDQWRPTYIDDSCGFRILNGEYRFIPIEAFPPGFVWEQEFGWEAGIEISQDKCTMAAGFNPMRFTTPPIWNHPLVVERINHSVWLEWDCCEANKRNEFWLSTAW